MADFDHSFQKLVAEAFAACGDDRAAIEAFVLNRVVSAPDADRARYRRDLDLFFRFQASGFREGDREN